MYISLSIYVYISIYICIYLYIYLYVCRTGGWCEGRVRREEEARVSVCMERERHLVNFLSIVLSIQISLDHPLLLQLPLFLSLLLLLHRYLRRPPLHPLCLLNFLWISLLLLRVFILPRVLENLSQRRLFFLQASVRKIKLARCMYTREISITAHRLAGRRRKMIFFFLFLSRETSERKQERKSLGIFPLKEALTFMCFHQVPRQQRRYLTKSIFLLLLLLFMTEKEMAMFV